MYILFQLIFWYTSLKNENKNSTIQYLNKYVHLLFVLYFLFIMTKWHILIWVISIDYLFSTTLYSYYYCFIQEQIFLKNILECAENVFHFFFMNVNAFILKIRNYEWKRIAFFISGMKMYYFLTEIFQTLVCSTRNLFRFSFFEKKNRCRKKHFFFFN